MLSIGSMPPSPQQAMQSQLSAQVEAGNITEEDSDAMMAALEAIHEDMAADGPPQMGTEPPSQEEMQEKLDGMLSEQVEAGTLTQEQADELSAMFESGEMGPPPPPEGGPGGPGGPGGFGGASGSEDTQDLMAKFLEELQSQSGYSGAGESTSASLASLLVDYKA